MARLGLRPWGAGAGCGACPARARDWTDQRDLPTRWPPTHSASPRGSSPRSRGRRASGERGGRRGRRAAPPSRSADEWGVTRALVADDPVLDELGVPDGPGRATAARCCAGPRAAAAAGASCSGWRARELTLGVTVPALGVAERGTLVLETGPGHGRSIDVVSMYHLAVLPGVAAAGAPWPRRLVETYAGPGAPPSAVSLVSAPSRTSDIEKISTLGAHGAKGLHLLIVEDR